MLNGLWTAGFPHYSSTLSNSCLDSFFFFFSNERSFINIEISGCSHEKGESTEGYNKGLKRKSRKRAVTFRPTQLQEIKRTPKLREIPVVLSNTPRFHSVQMAQMRAWREKTHIFHEDMHGDNDLQLKMRSAALAGRIQEMLTNCKVRPQSL